MLGSLLEGFPSGGNSHPGKRGSQHKLKVGFLLLLLLFGVVLPSRHADSRDGQSFSDESGLSPEDPQSPQSHNPARAL